MRTLTFKRIIGSGSMGTVYQAELRVPRGFCRPCAVKVMKNVDSDHEHFMARMRDEARLLGMLQDEQILGVSEMVMVEGRDAVIMDYVEGVDLGDLIKVKPVPPRALAELGAEIAGTLQRAHTAVHPSTGDPLNVIHRDIKPANVMITARGGVRLLDFGVARAAFSSRESKTQGLVLGTLNYFPPEILAGEEPTTAVDIYGLGVTVWECATGKQWGSPRVQQSRFERRVEQRLKSIEKQYQVIIPVLRQMLQWNPELRPSGGVVERALLHAADGAQGEGLRTWSRQVVPEILTLKRQEAPRDDIVGRTVNIEGEEEEPRAAQPMAMHTFNDFGPFAPVKRTVAPEGGFGGLEPGPVSSPGPSPSSNDPMADFFDDFPTGPSVRNAPNSPLPGHSPDPLLEVQEEEDPSDVTTPLMYREPEVFTAKKGAVRTKSKGRRRMQMWIALWLGIAIGLVLLLAGVNVLAAVVLVVMYVL